MLSTSQFVHICVCLSVCLCVCLYVHFLRYNWNLFLPPHPEVKCPKLLEIWNPWGKVMERSGLRFKNFYYQRVWNRREFCFTEQDFLVSLFLTLFNSLFVPTSQSPMSKHLRFLKSLGKSNGKKWSQIWELLLIKGEKSPQWKKSFMDFFHLLTLHKHVFGPTFQSSMFKLFYSFGILGEK